MKRLDENIERREPIRVRRPTAPGEPATLVDVFTRVVRDHNRADALNYKSDGRWVPISSDEMLAQANNIAAGWHAIGIRRGDRVALLSESRVEWTLTDAGCIFGGVIDVPIYPTLTPPQVRYILNDSGASALVIEGREKFDELKDILGECPEIKQIVYFDPAGMTSAEGLSLKELEDLGREFQQQNPRLLDDVAHDIT
ncbi:MAG TPA: AMP-binding protein, partial [Pyrinomonadaceae bacterium]|nr:AMP-binding protein [Pyrinomonadaceae bacterium]